MRIKSLSLTMISGVMLTALSMSTPAYSAPPPAPGPAPITTVPVSPGKPTAPPAGGSVLPKKGPGKPSPTTSSTSTSTSTTTTSTATRVAPPVNPLPSFYEMNRKKKPGVGDIGIAPPVNPLPPRNVDESASAQFNPKQTTSSLSTSTSPQKPKPAPRSGPVRPSVPVRP